MAYRRTENVVRRLAARHDAILAAAGALAAEAGINAVQIAPVAERAGIAAGTVYRYFPSKTDLVAALVASVSPSARSARCAAPPTRAPGPLSALAAALTTFAARALAQRKLAFALIAEPVDADTDEARLPYRGGARRRDRRASRRRDERAARCPSRTSASRRPRWSAR